MKFGSYFRLCLTLVLLGGSAAWGNDKELLKTADVHRIMNQIFAKHVDKKLMTDAILHNAFKVYIEQFDPHSIYFLESDVEPYIHIDEARLASISSEYKRNDFEDFEQLNEAIQNAILRARIIRKDLAEQKEILFKESKEAVVSGGPPYKFFAKTPEELRERIRKSLVNFLRSERARYGDDAVSARKAKLLAAYEERLRTFENTYLFVKDNGEPLPPAAKENLFVMHLLKALASSLDSHTTVYNPAEAYDMRIRLEKGVNSIGVSVKQTSQGLFISNMVKDGSADRSKAIQVNDQILKVNGQDISDLGVGQVMDLLQGNKGEGVVLSLKREADETPQQFEVKLYKEPVILDEDRASYTSENYGNGEIGIIKLDSFYQSETGFNAEKDVRNAISALENSGPLRGLILDLRKNSGGFLTQAVKVAGLFITNGVIVISKYSNGEEKFYRDMDGKEAFDGPLVVLTSRFTASAAEIVAQALQDYGVAIIVGDDHTYGKGTIQSQTVTEDGASSYFKVTVGKYYTVSGKTPQLQGVKADVVVPSPFSNEHIGEEYLEYALSQDRIPAVYKDPLKDIDPNLKSWYLKYYIPTLQHPISTWRDMLGALRKNSEYRLNRNPSYQIFLEGNTQKLPEAIVKDEELEESLAKPKESPKDDLQLREAINVVKDMIYLQTKSQGIPIDLPEGDAK